MALLTDNIEKRLKSLLDRAKSTFAGPARAKAISGLTVGAIALVGLVTVLSTQAAGFVVIAEPEAGSVTGTASIIGDTTASGGQGVQFGSGGTASWPTAPPAQICGNNSILGGGPTAAPAGAITVPAGANTGINWNQAGKTFWFAPGVHTLGTGQFSQIEPGSGSTYIGAPGAIIDGQNLNNFAFTQHATNVRIAYLTIRNFTAPKDQGVVNHDAGVGWTIEYNTINNNKGAALMGGQDNIYRYNCIKDNGQYAINSCCGGDTAATDIQDFIIDHNEISGNNTDDWETKEPGCGCTGGMKLWLNKNVTVSNNYIHHNHGPGVWLDNNNSGIIVENNYISDNDSQAFFAEAGYDFRFRYNNLLRNTLVECKPANSNCHGFPTGTIYISDNGAPSGYGLRFAPSVISNNNFDNNWGGITLWENADRYSGSSAHTHVSGTIKVGSIYDDAACDGANDTIPSTVGDVFKCRWSTENIVVENNSFRIDKAAVGCVGDEWCGLQAIFSNYGTYPVPQFQGMSIAWRVTFQQNNVFRNNTYKGQWGFNGWEMGNIVSFNNWKAAPPAIPANTSGYGSVPGTFGQDAGSTLTTTP